MRVTDVERAADRAESLALGVDGVVFAEQTSTNPRHPRYGDATLTLRVPPTAFAPDAGRSWAASARSWTASAAPRTSPPRSTDIASRLRSQQRSVARVRALLAQAKTIGEIVQVEGELSRREADLESLEAQQK